MIELTNISKKFNDGEVIALDHINLKIKRNEIFGFIGKSGAGKSTLLRLINKLERPTTGEVIIDRKKVNALSKKELLRFRKNIGMIFQGFNLLNSKTVKQNIAYPLAIANVTKEVIDEKIDEVLALVAMEDKKNVYPATLSGGEKQRVAIARAIINNPNILLCDEPTSALDPQTTHTILKLLKKINQALDITIVIITHELSVIRKICDRTGVLADGQLVDVGKTKKIFNQENITNQTQELLEVERWTV